MPCKIKFENIKKLFESYGLKILNNYTAYEFLRTNNGGYRLWHKSNPYSIYNINKYTKFSRISYKEIANGNYINKLKALI